MTFTIHRRSWTGSAYTVYDRNTLRQMAYTPTGVTASLDGAFDRWFAASLAQESTPGAPCVAGFTPETVRGIR